MAEGAEEKYLYDFASLEALLKGVNGYDDAALLALVKAGSGVDLAHPKKQYPLEVVDKFLQVVGEARFPELNARERMVALGRATSRGYPQTLVGRVMVAPLKVISPARAVQQMVKMFSTGISFGQRNLVKLAENDYVLQFRDDPGDPAFSEGVIQQFFEDMKLSDVRVISQAVGPKAFDVKISW